jgi:DNA repair protein RadD
MAWLEKYVKTRWRGNRMSMRPYQTNTIHQIQRLYSRGVKKILLRAPTGSGKTHMFSDIMKRTAEKGNPCIMVVRGRQLVDQASRRLFHEGVPHGVRMCDHWNKNYGAKVQVCSIDTLFSRGEFPEARLLVIDEGHLFTSKRCVEFVNHYTQQGTYVLAVTATPYGKESLRHLAEECVSTISMQELIDQGYLVRPRYFAPSAPDLKGVHTRNGDYVNEELEGRMSVLTGDIVSHWKQIAEGRPTLAFAVNIKHSLNIVEQFRGAGIPAEHIEGESTFEERNNAIEKLRKGEIKILSNVGVLCTGVDIPFASAILLARPTKSYNLYVQQCGRGTRIHPDKSDFIILDHAGNVLRHGFITEEPDVDLDGREVPERVGKAPRVCPECFTIYTGDRCHVCGKEAPPRDRKDIEIEEGTLRELVDYPKGREISLFISRMKEIAKNRKYKSGWTYHKVKDKYGEEAADRAFPGIRKRNYNNMPWFMRSV